MKRCRPTEKRRKTSIMRQYIAILVAACFTVLISFLVTSYIVSELYIDQSRESANVIFCQGKDNLTLFEEDIDNLYTNIASNSVVVSFLRADSLQERTAYLSEIQQIVASNMRISRFLDAVSIYNEADQLVNSNGKTFLAKPDGMGMSGLVTYTGRLRGADGTNRFGVVMPVYLLTGITPNQTLGSLFLVFNVDNLSSILSASLLNEKSSAAILDADGELIASAGPWLDKYAGMRAEDNSEYIIQTEHMEASGWRMIHIIPTSSLLDSIEPVRRINLLIYLVFLLAFGGVCGIVYWQMIKPIRRQTEFMTSYTSNTGARIAVLESNELGELARRMNEMLDGIETLNQRILDERKKYFELQYEKKQTEMIAFKSQINPHFMYNTFECIRGMALYHGEKEIAEITQSLAKLFRYNVKGDEIVTVREVLENTREYAKIIHYRFMGKYEVREKADPGALPEKIPKMLVQPFIENAVLHGLEPLTGKGYVEITVLAADSGGLAVSIADNGCGIEPETLEELRSEMEQYDRGEYFPKAREKIGILNTYQRMKLFYGRSARLDVASEKGRGTEIMMTLPARMQEEQPQQD